MRRKLLIIRRVVGSSMEPTLKDGRIVLASGILKLRERDVVVLEHSGLEKIKRISSIEGGLVFVAGDNPAKSTDSRQFGPLQSKVIIGTVIWPRRRTMKT